MNIVPPLPSTVEICKSALKGDPTQTPESIREILAYLRNPNGDQVTRPFFISLKDAAVMTSLEKRSINNLIREGVLQAVKLPGRKRRLGVTYESMQKFLATAQVEK